MPDFSMTRSAHVDAPPERVHALLDDFREWPRWSPWEELDHEVRHTYSGAERGVGAVHAWSGNRKAGEGRMEITESSPAAVVLDLEFLKPFRARNVTRFDLVPRDGGTHVAWTMTGRQGVLMRLLGRLFVDRAIAADFDRGLARLRTAAQS